MKCPKCKRKMELLFNQWRCYYCNPPDKNKNNTSVQNQKKDESPAWPWDEDWNGWHE